ncbi:MAG: SDR family oxidoreductase [Gammaproteobacteria bacterium AqS3]|nr:SDR family oxidoreductase [Gammaproteobacteria bacterium AqS3]
MAAVKVAWVTGGARRIGAAIARALHPDHDIVLHCHRSVSEAGALADELNGARPDSCRVFAADLCDLDQLAGLIGAVRPWRASVDVLVNNASSFYDTPLAALTPGQWDDLLNANLRAGFFLAQRLAEPLRSAGGAVVNLGDARADGGIAERAPYAVAKAAVHAMTRALAVELAPEVRVNAVAPGAILWPEPGSGAETCPEEILDRLPIRRTGTPGEIAAAVRFVIGASYLSGQILAVDGGWQAMH